jgi:hypothetical protein
VSCTDVCSVGWRCCIIMRDHDAWSTGHDCLCVGLNAQTRRCGERHAEQSEQRENSSKGKLTEAYR